MEISKKKKGYKSFFFVVALISIFIAPYISGLDFFSYPIDNLTFIFFGIIFFNGFELSTIFFFSGIIIFFVQVCTSLINTDKRITTVVNEDNDSYTLQKINIENSSAQFLQDSKNLNSFDFDEFEENIVHLDSVIKKSRHDVFNLILDSNGVNSPDDFQSAMESIELALSSLRSIKKQFDELKLTV